MDEIESFIDINFEYYYHYLVCFSVSVEGDMICYTNLNMRGDNFGNCGNTASAFLPCSPRYVCRVYVHYMTKLNYISTEFNYFSDVLCGQLQCSPGTYQNIYSTQGTQLMFTFSGQRICR